MKNKPVKVLLQQMPEKIATRCQIRKIQAGKIVVLKGNEIETIHICCQGKIQVKNEFENGFIYSFASIEPIAYIGAIEIMANKTYYSSTLQTMTECLLLEIPKEDFLFWITTDHIFALNVLQFVSHIIYEQSLKTGQVLAYPAICILIDYLTNVFENEDETQVFLEKTREEISSILGFTVRTLNRSLKLLKEENLIEVTRKGILITQEQYMALCKKLEQLK